MPEKENTARKKIAKRVVLHFPRRMVDAPILYKLIKDFDLAFNILKASITLEEEGLMVVELKGQQQNYDAGLEYLLQSGVRIQSLSQDVTRNEERCTSCGACVTICPAGALYMQPATRTVDFDSAKCVACGVCIKACPPRAMELHF